MRNHLNQDLKNTTNSSMDIVQTWNNRWNNYKKTIIPSVDIYDIDLRKQQYLKEKPTVIINGNLFIVAKKMCKGHSDLFLHIN